MLLYIAYPLYSFEHRSLDHPKGYPLKPLLQRSFITRSRQRCLAWIDNQAAIINELNKELHHGAYPKVTSEDFSYQTRSVPDDEQDGDPFPAI